jgi:creatine kinase
LKKNTYPGRVLSEEKTALAASGHCSFMAEYITPQLFAKYKDVVSGGNGNWTFARAINTGAQFPRAIMGIHAGDPESYDTCIDMFKPCAERYHAGFKWDDENAHRTDLNADHIEGDLTDLAAGMIVSTRIRVARNLGKPFVMNPNGNVQTREAVPGMVRQCALTFPPELAGNVYTHAEITVEEEQQLIDDHILFKGRDARQAAAGYHRDWPSGRGIFCSADKSFHIWVNEGGHLRIMCIFSNSDMKGVMRKAATSLGAMETAIRLVTGTDTPIATHPVGNN